MQVLGNIKYQKIEKIGIGQGMNSNVFLVDELQLGGKLAVKEIAKSNFANSIPNYFQEAQAMFASSHRNIVPIQYACETSDYICLAMPYCKNGSLADSIKTNPLSLKDLIFVGQEILQGIAQIHIQQYLHLDIKPSNILFSDQQIPMLADFGQSRAIDKDGIISTLPPMYRFGMPPECLSLGVATIESDVYQVGLTLYRAINGDNFFNHQVPLACLIPEHIKQGKFPNRNQFMPHVPQKLRTIIRKALKVQSSQRYNSATAFADDLAKVSIKFNWNITIKSNCEIRWQAKQGLNRPDIIVDLLKDQTKNSAWQIQLYTQRCNKSPRAYKKDIWQSGLLYNQAFNELKRIFQDLERG